MTVPAAASAAVGPSWPQAYREKGYAALPRVFDAEEVAAIRRECDRLAQRPELFTTGDPLVAVREDAHGRPRPDRIDFPCRSSAELRALSADARLRAIVSEALGEPGSLFKDKLILKPPGTAGYEPHQDYPYWEFLRAPADAVVTLLIAVDAAPPASGPMVVYPGRHHARLPGPPDAPLDVSPEALASARSELAVLGEGDVFAFHSLVPHHSARNESSRPRRALLLSYCWSRWGEFYERSAAAR